MLSRRALARLVVVLGVYCLIFCYTPLRLALLLIPEWRPGAAALMLMFSGPALAWVASRTLPRRPFRWLLRSTYVWLGACFITFSVLVPWEILRLLIPMPAPLEGVLPAAVSAALIAWACLNAQRLVVRRLNVAARRIAQPLRLVQISDLHIGSRSPAFLRRVIERVNRLEPDLVLITGDVVDLGDITAAELAPIARLQAPSFFAIGNHERYIDCDAVCATFTAMGVTVLRDDIASAFGLQIVGIDDAENRGQVPLALAELGPRLDRDAYKILLYHRPDAFEAAAEAGIDLMLCGHTHNGQIVPFNWVVKHSFPRIVGRFEYRQATLYVSPGTGTWGPSMRLGSQNEISVIELSATDAPTSGE